MKKIIRQALTAFLSVFMICMTFAVPVYAKAAGTKTDPFIMTAGKVMHYTWNYENSGEESEGIYNLLTIPADGCVKLTFSKPYEPYSSYYGTYHIAVTDAAGRDVIRFRTVTDYSSSADAYVSYKIGLEKGSYLMHMISDVNFTFSDQLKCDATYKYTFTETAFYESEPNDAKNTADPMKAGSFYSGETGEADSSDFYSISLKKGTVCQLKLKGYKDMPDAGMRLMSPSGKVKFLRQDDSSVSGGARVWTFKADADGKYYLAVSCAHSMYPWEYKVCIAKAPAGSLVTIDGTEYYIGSAGKIGKGWKQIGKKWYYFDKKGMAKGWKKIASKQYYFGEDGARVSGWQKIGKKQYYFSKKGVMITGWKKIAKKWYYFSKKGVMTAGWKKLSGKWYYFGKDGVMVTGVQVIGKKVYNFSSKGIMQKGWKKKGSFWYYFGSDGAMVSGKKVKISGKTYEFLGNGVMYDKGLVEKAAKKYAGVSGTPDDLVYSVTKTALGMGGNAYSCLDPKLAHPVPASKARPGDIIAYVDTLKSTLMQTGVYLGGYRSFQVIDYDGVITDYRSVSYYDTPGYETQFYRIDNDIIGD